MNFYRPRPFEEMGVSKNRGTPKWMVKIMENPIKMDDLGGKPTIFGNTQMLVCVFFVENPGRKG